jgi:hypothetical protein
MRLERRPGPGVDEQRLEDVLDPLRRADDAVDARAALPAGDDGEIAGPGVAGSLAVDDDRHARREVRLAYEQLPAPRELDDRRLV